MPAFRCWPGPAGPSRLKSWRGDECGDHTLFVGHILDLRAHDKVALAYRRPLRNADVPEGRQSGAESSSSGEQRQSASQQKWLPVLRESNRRLRTLTLRKRSGLFRQTAFSLREVIHLTENALASASHLGVQHRGPIFHRRHSINQPERTDGLGLIGEGRPRRLFQKRGDGAAGSASAAQSRRSRRSRMKAATPPSGSNSL